MSIKQRMAEGSEDEETFQVPAVMDVYDFPDSHSAFIAEWVWK